MLKIKRLKNWLKVDSSLSLQEFSMLILCIFIGDSIRMILTIKDVV